MSAPHSLEAEVRLYDHLFLQAESEDDEGRDDVTAGLNPDSLETLTSCRVEPSLAAAAPGNHYQFERQGYFCVDSVDSTPEALVFNRTVSLRDSWAKIERSKKRG